MLPLFRDQYIPIADVRDQYIPIADVVPEELTTGYYMWLSDCESINLQSVTERQFTLYLVNNGDFELAFFRDAMVNIVVSFEKSELVYKLWPYILQNYRALNVPKVIFVLRSMVLPMWVIVVSIGYFYAAMLHFLIFTCMLICYGLIIAFYRVCCWWFC